MPAKGEVVIDGQLCKGCSLCIQFCAKGCLSLTGEGVSSQGANVPSFVAPEKCNGCGICGRMCPDFAIEVFRVN